MSVLHLTSTSTSSICIQSEWVPSSICLEATTLSILQVSISQKLPPGTLTGRQIVAVEGGRLSENVTRACTLLYLKFPGRKDTQC